MFDTHCHLQFGAFAGQEEAVLRQAKKAGMTHMMIPSTDVETARKAIDIVRKLGRQGVNMYVAVGIHPHHIFEYQKSKIKMQDYKSKIKNDVAEIEKLLKKKEVVAVGEVGVDRYYYRKTRHEDYAVTEEFVALQREVMKAQIKLALDYDKSLILHNREAKKDLLDVLSGLSGLSGLAGRTVLHCCEPDLELLAYAREHGFYLGVDGDVTYSQEKAEFIEKVPLEMLVLETDSPFLTPSPIRDQLDKNKRRPRNEPANLRLIAQKVADLNNIPVNRLIAITTENAKRLFRCGRGGILL